MNTKLTTNKIKTSVERFTDRHDGHRPGPVRAALIDMDGTLYDSMPWHARAWHRMITELGIEANVDEFFSYEGMTGEATINLIFKRAFNRSASADEVKDLYAKKTRYFRESNKATIMPGAQRMVTEFKSYGIKTILVTGSGQASLIDRINADFDNAFSLQITAHDVRHGKPHPEPYLRGLEKADVSPLNAVVIENAPLGVESGARAGIFTIGLTTGPIPAEKLYEAGADIVYKSMEELADSLPELLYIINT